MAEATEQHHNQGLLGHKTFQDRQEPFFCLEDT